MDQLLFQDVKYLLENERLKSFEDWPNDRNWPSCTPEKLAEAGFFFKPDGDCLDNVCCAFCWKELDGWEPDDDPKSEHKKHSAKCPFMKQEFAVEDMTLTSFVRFIGKIHKFRSEQMLDKLKVTFSEEAKVAEDIIVSHVNKK